MKNTVFKKSLDGNVSLLRELLPAEDVIVFSFSLASGEHCSAFYTDGLVNKSLLSREAVTPLTRFKGEAATTETLLSAIPFPEKHAESDPAVCAEQILEGNAVILCEGVKEAFVLGVKSAPARAVAEPPTDVALKGPRAGFVEELKTNLALLRLRLKTPGLLLKTVSVGRRGNTKIAICYLDGVAKTEIAEKIEERLKKIDTDGIPDSSYVADFLSERPLSVFRQTGTTEKPDILAAKMLEGRIGILVDGSPIALTLPYIAAEDFQSCDDYFVNPYRATFNRFLRFFSLLLAIYLPAFYVSAQLFKLQILPLGLLLTVASSIQGLALSPSMEMFLTLLVLEILTEASIRMPKYVGLALSVVGALVLGDTAVNAGFLSTPAILIIALSGICLYTVPNLLETTSVIRLVMLLLAGSVGVYGVLLFTAFLAYYLFSAESYGAPLFAPFAPFIAKDFRDAGVKYELRELATRPRVLKPKNKVRLKNGK